MKLVNEINSMLEDNRDKGYKIVKKHLDILYKEWNELVGKDHMPQIKDSAVTGHGDWVMDGHRGYPSTAWKDEVKDHSSLHKKDISSKLKEKGLKFNDMKKSWVAFEKNVVAELDKNKLIG